VANVLDEPAGAVCSVNTAGSAALEPYTAVVDFTTTRLTVSDFWQAASSCIEPMTFSSLVGVRPTPRALDTTELCTTVSTWAWASTRAISGLRMSARTNSVRPRAASSSGPGGIVSTPITRSTEGSAAS
jgi:hypothetical protein